MTINVEAEPHERENSPLIEWIWRPALAGKPNYNPYGLLPESSRIFIESTKDDYRWEADFEAGRSGGEGLVCFGVRDFNPSLGRWLDHDQAGCVERADLYPMPRENDGDHDVTVNRENRRTNERDEEMEACEFNWELLLTKNQL